MDTHGSWSAVGHTYYLQLIWQGPVYVGLHVMDLDLSESDFSLTTCNEIGFGYYGQLRTTKANNLSSFNMQLCQCSVLYWKSRCYGSLV